MWALAKENLNGNNSVVELGDIEKVEFGKEKYELIVSRLVLHYIADLGVDKFAYLYALNMLLQTI